MTRKWSGASGGCFYPLRFQEGSLWDYSLFRGTERVDTFSVAPEYWEGPEDVPDDQLRRWRGDAQKLAALWQLPVERIDRYIVQWGLYDIDEDPLTAASKAKLIRPTDPTMATLIRSMSGSASWIAYALLVPCIAIFIYLSRRIERDERPEVSAVTADRPALTPEEFGTSYFSGEAAHVATRCRKIFAEFYRFDSSRIHPDDKLYAELRFAAQDALEADEFLMAIEEEFGVTFSSAEARHLLTMRDITEAVLRKLHNEA